MELRVTPVYGKLNKLYTSGNYRQIVLYGGSRSSKTYSLMQLAAVKLIETPGLRITVWRNEKVVCRATIMEDFKSVIYSDKFLNDIFIENKAKGTFTNKLNGAKILFEGADSESKVLGMHQHVSIFNEISEFNERVYLQITQRTEDLIFADYNPAKRFWFDRMKLRADTVYSHSYYRDNPFLAEQIVKQLESYEPWETGSYEIVKGVCMYKGKPISASNQPPPHIDNIKSKTANVFWWLVYGLGISAEKPEKVYKGWSTISVKDYNSLPYDKYYGLDFGSANPSALVEVKYDGDRTFYLRQKIYEPMTLSNDSLGDKIYKVEGMHKDTLIVADSAKQEYLNMLRNVGLKVVGAKKGAGSVNPGIEIVQMFDIVYTEDSIDIADEESGYSWDLDRYNKPTDNVVKKDDHIMDAIRYIIHYLYYYLNIKIERKK